MEASPEAHLEARLEALRTAALTFESSYKRAIRLLVDHLANGSLPTMEMQPPIPPEVRSWFQGDPDEPVIDILRRLHLTCKRFDWPCGHPEHERLAYALCLVRSVCPILLRRQEADFPLLSDARTSDADLHQFVLCLIQVIRCPGRCWESFKHEMRAVLIPSTPAPS